MGQAKHCLCCWLPRWGATLAGLAAVLLALFAGVLGIDKDLAWGPRRQGLLWVGLVLLVVAHWSAIEQAIADLWHALARLGPGGPGDGHREVDPPDTARRDAPRATRITVVAPLRPWQKSSVLLSLFVVVLVYVWFASLGYWFDWPKGTSYYDLLAEGFLHGRTSLMVEPDPQLLEMNDPYSPEERAGVPVLWDASYFQGKYFLYWGPAPAAALILPKLLLHREIPDVYVVFAAASLMLVASTAILLWLWRRFFVAHLPFWLLPFAVLLVGFGPPMLWALGGANVYEAAGSTGIAALLAAVYLALPVFASEETSRGRLALASLLLGIVMASRLALGLAAGGLLVLLLARLVWRRKDWREFALDAGSLLVPLAMSGILLAWYNFDRFGNVLETGYRYQLTTRTDSIEDVFDVRYLIPNAYNYILRPFRTLSVFPFIKPIPGVEAVPYLPVNIHPPLYTTQHVTGTLLTVPAILWATFLGWWAICGTRCRWSGLEETEPGRRLRSITTSLFVVAVLACLPTGLYYFVANRFLMDFMPLAMILSALGAWVAVARHRRKATEILFRAIVASTFVASVVMTFLLAVSGDQFRFERLNPELFDWITRLLA